MIDLHVHSVRSDGTLTPTELVDYAIKKGLSAFALTDHDTTDGLEEAMEYANCLRKKLSNQASEGTAEAKSANTVPEIIPGIELSTDDKGTEVHIVGLFIDPANPTFREYLTDFVNSRDVRNQKMCLKLQELGLPVVYEELLEKYPGCILTRAHFARHLKDLGYVKSNQEAFDRYLGNRRPAYVPREKITPRKAVELVLIAGGLPILAHPILYRMSDARLDALTADLKSAGLVGIEAIYSTYSSSEERQIRRLAEKHDLLISGGSDFHGSNKPNIDLGTGLGKLFVPDEVLANLKGRIQRPL